MIAKRITKKCLQVSCLLAESQNLIIPSGIVTMDMATDDEKALIFEDKILKKMPTSMSGTYSALHTEVIHCSKK